ncbi:MAG TPA: hypothetical protein VG244_07685 [Acidimicrobiales bacterium]|nr:hypothetical protein [Acidimicrobiales bacterium]
MGFGVRGVPRVELGGERLDGSGVDADLAVDLAGVERLIGVGRARRDVGEGAAVVAAVGLGVLGRGLAEDLGEIVVEAVVPGAVVVLQQLALLAQGAVEVGVGGA